MLSFLARSFDVVLRAGGAPWVTWMIMTSSLFVDAGWGCTLLPGLSDVFGSFVAVPWSVYGIRLSGCILHFSFNCHEVLSFVATMLYSSCRASSCSTVGCGSTSALSCKHSFTFLKLYADTIEVPDQGTATTDLCHLS